MMRFTCVIALVLACAGCNELVDIDRFRVVDAASTDGSVDRDASMDAGENDAGSLPDGGGLDGGETVPDGCTLQTFYRDADEDLAGDPEDTIQACEMPDGYVADAGDCDDTAMAVRPGSTESCDAVDEDCDGAIDEGLIGPLGTPIIVEPDLGFGDAAWSHATHGAGHAVVWRTDSDATVLATFYALDGTPVVERTVVETSDDSNGPPREPVIARYEAPSGAESLLVAYLQDDQITWRRYSPDGTSPPVFQAVPTGAGAEDLRVLQVGHRMMFAWTTSTSLLLTTLHPDLGAMRTPLEIPLPTSDPGGSPTGPTGSFASAAGAAPHVLIPWREVTLNAGSVMEAHTEILRVTDAPTLVLDPRTGTDFVDRSDRCAALGTAVCLTAGASLHGTNTTADAPAVMIHGVYGADSVGGSATAVSMYAYPLRPMTTGLPELGAGSLLGGVNAIASTAAPRGSTAPVVVPLASGQLQLSELSLTTDADGSVPSSLPTTFSMTLPRVSAYRGAASIAGSLDSEPSRNVSLLRLGCSAP